MAKVATTVQLHVVKNGGPITSDTYIGDGSSTWKKGEILKITNGTTVAVAAGAVDTDFTGTAAARLFVALSDQAAATSGYVSVQEITDDTVLLAQLSANASGSPVAAQGLIGDSYAGLKSATGIISVDVDNTTKPIFKVVDAATNFNPHDPDVSDDYGYVYVKILAAILA